MSILRSIYYRLPVKLRYVARKICYYPLDLLRKRPALIPPEALIYTGSGDFERQGKEWLAFFLKEGNLKEDSNVLDIGSGIGRIAIPMTSFLKGTYHGFDAVEQGVDWCKRKISARFPNFHFLFVDLFNDLYKERGIDASSYRFPYQDQYFDFACAISVFTHMMPAEVENYLQEANRVLKPGAVFIATFFILDEDSRELMKLNDKFNFRYQYDNYALMDEKVKAANIAFDRRYLNDLIDRHGFIISKSIPGFWPGREKTLFVGFQDILVLTKK